jgi:hypothetical protein
MKFHIRVLGMKKFSLHNSRIELGMILLIIFISSSSKSAILWNDSEPVKKSRFKYERTEEALEVSDFWSKRKMGIGIVAAGAYGLIGSTISIHFHPQWSVDLGFGGGSHFQSFGFRIKKMLLLSSPLNPYFAFGFQRWQRGSTRPMNAEDISPGYISKNFLSDEERKQGLINEKLVQGALGIQYTITQGDWIGYGFFIEGLFLVSVEDFSSAPTASFGMNYFF